MKRRLVVFYEDHLHVVLDSFSAQKRKWKIAISEKITYICAKDDSDVIFTGDVAGCICQLDLGTNQPILSFHLNVGSEIVQICSNGDQLLVSSKTHAYLVNCQTREYRLVGEKSRNGYFGACFSPVNSPELRVYSARRSSRIWVANSQGQVLSTQCYSDVQEAKLFRLVDNYLEPILDKGNLPSISEVCQLFCFDNLLLAITTTNVLLVIDLDTLLINYVVHLTAVVGQNQKRILPVQEKPLGPISVFLQESPRSLCLLILCKTVSAVSLLLAPMLENSLRIIDPPKPLYLDFTDQEMAVNLFKSLPQMAAGCEISDYQFLRECGTYLTEECLGQLLNKLPQLDMSIKSILSSPVYLSSRANVELEKSTEQSEEEVDKVNALQKPFSFPKLQTDMLKQGSLQLKNTLGRAARTSSRNLARTFQSAKISTDEANKMEAILNQLEEPIVSIPFQRNKSIRLKSNTDPPQTVDPSESETIPNSGQDTVEAQTLTQKEEQQDLRDPATEWPEQHQVKCDIYSKSKDNLKIN
ncbi:Hermansky-Pudlak syndrome 5 [Cichlidogyrus casuarinus]|uniref:Hermansky-Pudlak syndrome 5 n=1 Tax=Cichlidogyrus casuarinus TaxID=1844966 RepID=A0ABD2PZY1_9PLAT